MIRPGPDRIEPRRVPGGVVAQVYDLDGVLLVQRELDDRPTLEAEAEADAAFVAALSSTQGLILVTYDGDTGERVTLLGPPGARLRWRLR